MAETLKVLAQSAPAAATPVDAYTVAASTSTTVSSIVVCNRSATDTTFRLSVAVAGAGAADEQYLYYDEEIKGNTTFIATIGLTLAATDVLRVYATLATVSFNVFGVEVT